MIIPANFHTFKDSLRAGAEIFRSLKENLKKDSLGTSVGDEGGFAPNIKSVESAIEIIIKSIKDAGYKSGKDIFLSLDSASSEFFKNDMFLDANEVIYSIKISPVIDLKKIINEENLRAGEIRALFDKLVFDDADLMTDSFKSDYEYHSLEISLSAGSKFTTIEKIVDYINANPLFVDLKEQGLNSISRTIYANELTIKQIDRILENYSISPEKNDNTSQLYIDNKQVQPNELIKTKILLQQQNEDLKQQKLLSEKTLFSN